jgi:L-arabinokinase
VTALPPDRARLEIVAGSTRGLPDAERFLERLRGLGEHPLAEARALFERGREIFTSRAPGRLDVMGGIADYSGSLVLQLPLREATFAAVQRDPSRRLRIVSLCEAEERTAAFEMDLDAFERSGPAETYEAARAFFAREPRTSWAAYVAGVFLVLRRERGASFAEGARVLIDSDVPAGKGVSSSAALEVAAMTAVAAAFELPLEARETALLCQIVENRVVGAPCGVMDQMTSVSGEADRLLSLLCQPAELRPSVPLPDDLAVFGIDSGVRHAVSGADYTSVRVGAFMGYRMLAEHAAVLVRSTAAGAGAPGDRRPPSPAAPGTLSFDDRFGGYLANVTPSELQQEFAGLLPERMRGRDFLDRYGGTTDPVTRVLPDREYAVRVPTAHPIHEHFRVRAFAELLGAEPTEERRRLLGELMYQSHASYSACGLGSAATDRIVALARESGPAEGIYGAKITGGGSGGTVALLARSGEDGRAAVARVAGAYARAAGLQRATLFAGSSPGAAAFGHLRARLRG